MKAPLVLLVAPLLSHPAAVAGDSSDGANILSPTRAPVEGTGSDYVSDAIMRTLAPTVDVVALAGRAPPRPTPRPSNPPTVEGMGGNVDVVIPGVAYGPEGQRGPDAGEEATGPGTWMEGTEPPTYQPTDTPRGTSVAAAKAAPNALASDASRRGMALAATVAVGSMALVATLGLR